MTNTEPIIEIERISIVTPIQGRDGSVMAERVMTFGGETRAIAPVNLYVGDFDGATLPQAVRDAIAGINTQLQSRIDTLTAQRDEAIADLATATQQLEASQALVAQREEQIATLQARINELTNPPSPFPDANWQAFRTSALVDPAVQRVAAGNPVLWPVLFMYLSELSTNPSRGPDIAWLWNTMEAQTPVTKEEVDRVNAIAAANGVPLRMNDEGQIQLP